MENNSSDEMWPPEEEQHINVIQVVLELQPGLNLLQQHIDALLQQIQALHQTTALYTPAFIAQNTNTAITPDNEDFTQDNVFYNMFWK